MVVAKLLLEEALDGVEMLDGLVVVVVIDCRRLRILDLQILLKDELLPELNDFREETPCLLDGVFLLKQQTHVVVTTEEIDRLGAVLFTLNKDGL